MTKNTQKKSSLSWRHLTPAVKDKERSEALEILDSLAFEMNAKRKKKPKKGMEFIDTDLEL